MESQQPPEIRLIGELFQTYILAEIDGMFVAVDTPPTNEFIRGAKGSERPSHGTAAVALSVLPVQRRIRLCVGPPGTNSAHGIFGRKFWE